MNESELFNAAIKLSAAERVTFLELACKDNPELRSQVKGLLKAHFDSATSFDESADKPADGRLMETLALTGPMEHPGTMIAGRYKLIEAIGEGGMGSVWLAEQKEPVRRKVAVKLIKAGMDSKNVLARFEAERQALAIMDHPNIAKVFDGGVTDHGRPFFVMEYVKGVPLTEYCDQARLSLKERLNLFMPVCQAVQHAHQKGIIHRDLKPSNILICLYDGKPVPKVIDFGLAKAMHQSLTEHSLHTAIGMMVGTPLYMSPEQAEHNNLDVDTRTDIYSLGVILYELLTGSTPLERQQLKAAAVNEVLRLIKEVEPPKPSTRLSSSLSLPSIAAQRSIEPNQLKKSLIGDLDWIVMKALDKERSRRYETANGLARDIDRFLNDEAIEACPPSTAYRLKKLLRRNKGTMLAASLLLLALVAGTAAVLAVQVRANANLRSVNAQLDMANNELQSSNTLLEQQRARAEEREQQAIDAVRRFGDAVSNNAELKNSPALELLRKALLKEPIDYFKTLRTSLQKGSDTKSESLARLAAANFDLGKLTDEIGNQQDALIEFKESLAIRQQLANTNPNDTQSVSDLANSHHYVGRLLHATGQLDEALLASKSALAIRQQLADANPTVTQFQSDLAFSHNNIATVLSKTGNPIEALQEYEAARAIQQKLADAHPTESDFQKFLAVSYHNIGVLRRDTGQPVEALQSLESALAIRQQLVDAHPTDTEFRSDLAFSHNHIGIILSETGKPIEALQSFESARSIQQKLVDGHPTATRFQSCLADSLNNIAVLLHASGKPREALEASASALAIQQQLANDNPTVIQFQRSLASSHNNIGVLLRASGKPGEALEANESALAIQEQLADANPTVIEFQRSVADSHTNIGILLDSTGKADEALQAYESALSIRERLLRSHPESPVDASGLAMLLHNMANIDLAAGRFDEARGLLQQAINGQKKALAANPRNPQYRQFLANHLANLIKAAQGLGDSEGVVEAERELAVLRDSDPAMLALDARLAVIINGEQQPVKNAERLALAQRAYEKSLHATAARLWAEALEADPKLGDDREAGHRYNAACSASLAASGAGKDDPPLDVVAKATLRKQALDWLRAELIAWTGLVESGPPETRVSIAQTLEHWQQDSDLASLRDEAELAKLPAEEQQAFQQLWTKVAELLEKSKT